MTHVDAIIFEPLGSLTDSPSAPPYDDAVPALTELKALGLTLIAASSLPHDELTSFLDSSGLRGFFDGVSSAESTAGDRGVMLREALASAQIAPDHALFITDSADGLAAARAAGVHGVLMMNDPDEAMKLTAHNPAGGIVSLLELPDLVRFVSATRSAYFGG
ncbi:MAG TPA: HAD family hydrolase [Vicinamibacterales bacterium]|nr:HAD family hydrolase [Vicinamibacterales bacterium]